MNVKYDAPWGRQSHWLLILSFLVIGILSLILWMVGVRAAFITAPGTPALLLIMVGLTGFTFCVFSALYILIKRRLALARLNDSHNQILSAFLKRVLSLQILMIGIVYTFFITYTGWIIGTVF